jgi:uncharacterized protein YcbX
VQLQHLFRYPVKGLTAEKLPQVDVTPGNPIPWDRAFALALDGVAFNPQNPQFLPKVNFLQLMKYERAALLQSRFVPDTGILSIKQPNGDRISENVLMEAGRERIASYLTAFMRVELKGSPRLVFAPGHSFSDARERVVSLINLASIRALEDRVGAPRHLMRFRANFYVSGAEPWDETTWGDREIKIGEATIRIIRFIPRCPATQVNPETAERDADPVRELKASFGHVNLGAFAEVIRGGSIRQGDAVVVR